MEINTSINDRVYSYVICAQRACDTKGFMKALKLSHELFESGFMVPRRIEETPILNECSTILTEGSDFERAFHDTIRATVYIDYIKQSEAIVLEIKFFVKGREKPIISIIQHYNIYGEVLIGKVCGPPFNYALNAINALTKKQLSTP